MKRKATKRTKRGGSWLSSIFSTFTSKNPVTASPAPASNLTGSNVNPATASTVTPATASTVTPAPASPVNPANGSTASANGTKGGSRRKKRRTRKTKR